MTNISSKLKLAGLFAVAALTTAGLTGCNNAGEGALSGGGLGAAAGAIIGSLSGNAGTGAAIGAVAGGLGGAVIGDQNARHAYAPGYAYPTAPAPVYGAPVYGGPVYYARPYYGPVVVYERNTCRRGW